MGRLKVYNGSSWVTALGKVYNGSSWVEKMNFFDGTDQIPLYPTGPGPTVSMNLADIYKLYFSATGTSYARLRFETDGNEETNNLANIDTINSTARGAWLDGGVASDVWVERIVNSGSLDYDDPGAGRLNLGTARTYGVSYSTPPTGSSTANVTFNFYDAASGGSLLQSVTIDITAETNDA